MIVVRTLPPNFHELVKVFPEARGHGALFTWGNRIYNPSGVQIPRPLLVHEEVHHQRQGEVEAEIERWWRSYLVDPAFRLAEELPAHRAEFRAFRAGRHGFSKKGMLHHIAERLAGPFYGNLMSYAEAVKAIAEPGV